MDKKISAAILAGGSGKRLNDLVKSKIVIDGKQIISRIIDTLGDIFDEILIITNTPAEFNEFSYCKIFGDQLLNKGPLGGIHAALKNAGNESIFIVAGDMPFLRKEIIAKQMDFFKNIDCDILIPKIGKFIEPLHGIYRKTISLKLEAFLETEENYAIHEFFKIVNTKYLDFEGTEDLKRAFTNINSASDILNVKPHPGLTE